MKNNLALVFYDFINQEIEKHTQVVIEEELYMFNLFSLIYDLRYTEEFEIDRITPLHMRELKTYPTLYTKTDIDELEISEYLKAYMKTIVNYQNHVRSVNSQINYLKFLISFKKSTYFAIMQVVFLNLAKIILNGFSLNFGFGLGTISLIWAQPKDKKVIDWYQSVQKRNDIIERGGIPYYKFDEEVSITNGIEYKGEEWIVRKDCSLKLYLRWAKNKQTFYKKVDYRTFCNKAVTTIISENRRIEDFHGKSKTYIMNTLSIDILRKAYVLMEQDKLYYLKFRNINDEIGTSYIKQNNI